MMRRLPLAALLSTQLMIAGVAQQPRPTPTPAPPVKEQPPPPESDDVVRITTNLVQFDAVITDGKGKLVTDLKPEEVEIYEDGRKQDLTHFYFSLAETESAPSNPKPRVDKNAPPAPPRPLRPENVRRTIALVVDDLGLSFESMHFVRGALKKFVDEQMQPGDLVAIIRTGAGMGSLQQFTTDKRQLYAAIERVRFYMSGRGGIGAFAPFQPPTPGPGGAQIDAFDEESNQFREEVFTVGTLGAVQYVVRGLRQLPGRKSVLLISDGFRFFTLGNPERNVRARRALEQLIDEAGRSSVVVYTINATGLQTLGFTAADNTAGMSPEQFGAALSARRLAAFETQQGLDYLASETGGIAIKNQNDLSKGIRRVLDDQKGFYLIGYRPDESTFDSRGRRQFHKLSMKITRPGKFNVRMRKGFFGIEDADRPKPQTLNDQLIAALISPFGATGVHLRLTSIFANDAQSGSFVRSVLYIDPKDLTFTVEPDGSHKTQFDILAVTFGDNGAAIDQHGRSYTLAIPDKEFARVMRDGLVYYVTVPIKKPGAYQLRMSLRDTASERLGSASQFIDAPDIKKKRLVLSGVVVRGEDNIGDLQAMSAEDGRDSGSAAASPAVRQFKQGGVMVYGFVIYNARLDKATARPQLTTQAKLYRDGKEIFVGKELPYDAAQQTDRQRLTAGAAIQLGAVMEPGDYVLQVIVTDLLADKKHRVASQWIDFQIVD